MDKESKVKVSRGTASQSAQKKCKAARELTNKSKRGEMGEGGSYGFTIKESRFF